MNKRISKPYYIYYHKRKYAICEADLGHNKYGFRSIFSFVTCCIVDNKLNKRKKQLIIHRLITGKGLKTIKL